MHMLISRCLPEHLHTSLSLIRLASMGALQTMDTMQPSCPEHAPTYYLLNSLYIWTILVPFLLTINVTCANII